MVRGIVSFLVLWAVVAGGITVFRQMAMREKFDMLKLLLWSGVTAVIAFSILIVIVLVF